VIVLDEFRAKKIGAMSLETPEDVESYNKLIVDS